jgi:hypothetical protein
LLPNLAQIALRIGFILHDGSAADHFQIRDSGEVDEDFILHAISEVGIGFFLAQILKRQDGDRFTFDGNCEWRLFRGFHALLRM